MSAKDNDDDGGDAGGIGGEDVRTPANDTALHVLKGAIVKALGPRAAVTAGVRFSTAWKATITVEYSAGGKPTEDELAAIQAAATAYVAADLPVKEFKMEKAAAEAKYKAAPVNHTYVYDKFPVKAGLTDLNVVEIDGCNVNACQGPHLKRTGELKGVFLQKQKYRKARNQHEFSFVCGDAAVTGLAEKAAAEAKAAALAKNKIAGGKPAPAPAAGAAPAAAAPAAGAGGDAKPKGGKEKGKDKGDKKADAKGQGKSDAKAAPGTGTGTGAVAVAAPGAGSKPTALEVVTKEVVEQTLRTVTAAVSSDPAAVAKVEALRAALHEQVKASLCSFQSAAYQAGYASRVVERQQNIADRL